MHTGDANVNIEMKRSGRLTLGMVATRRMEEISGVAKRSGAEKTLSSLCALRGGQQHLHHMLAIETARCGTLVISLHATVVVCFILISSLNLTSVRSWVIIRPDLSRPRC